MGTTATQARPRPHRPLLAVSAAMALLCVIAVGGLLLDDRTVLGTEPIWLKTFKFTVSIALYTATLAWMLTLLPRWRRTGWWFGTVVAAALGFEMVLMVWQMIGRGRRLHFNHADATDDTIHNLLAGGAYLAWLGTLLVALLLAVLRLRDKALAASVRFGLVAALAGMALAIFMFTPTPEQAAEWSPGHRPDIIGAHGVGVADGGPGLPVLGWSTVGGDLRVPHFVGLHALQALPLLALALTLLARRVPALRDARLRLWLVRLAGVGWLATVALLTWQALRGQSVVHPDGTTLLAAAGILAVVGTGAVVSLRASTARRAEPTAGDLVETAPSA